MRRDDGRRGCSAAGLRAPGAAYTCTVREGRKEGQLRSCRAEKPGGVRERVYIFFTRSFSGSAGRGSRTVVGTRKDGGSSAVGCMPGLKLGPAFLRSACSPCSKVGRRKRGWRLTVFPWSARVRQGGVLEVYGGGGFGGFSGKQNLAYPVKGPGCTGECGHLAVPV